MSRILGRPYKYPGGSYKTSINLSKDNEEWLQEQMEARGVSRSEVLNDALDNVKERI